MSSKADRQEKMHRFIDAIIEDFGGTEAPMTRMNMLFLTQFMESQSIFLNMYQEYLNTTVKEGDDVHEENMKDIAKNFMKAYLELLKLQRKNREKFKKVQSEIVKDYLDMVQDTLDHIDHKMPDSGAQS